jgi:hypothetical protein
MVSQSQEVYSPPTTQKRDEFIVALRWCKGFGDVQDYSAA